jgi:ADP-ribose pyrophosphatase
VLNNFTSLYLATGGKKIGEQKLDYNEDIEIQLFPLEEVRTMLTNNEIVQAMHSTCLFYGFSKLDSNP